MGAVARTTVGQGRLHYIGENSGRGVEDGHGSDEDGGREGKDGSCRTSSAPATHTGVGDLEKDSVSFFLKNVEPVMATTRLAHGCALDRVLGVKSDR